MRYIPFILLSTLLLGCSSDVTKTDSIQESNTSPEISEDNSQQQPVTDGYEEGSFANQMLTMVNRARSEEQNCGGMIMPPVPELNWNRDLEAAAFRHSSDMANANFMRHTGSDNSTLDERVSNTGYSANALAENIAEGQQTIGLVMSSWMNSSGHCQNIMNANISELGASAVENGDTIYWTQVFANPW